LGAAILGGVVFFGQDAFRAHYIGGGGPFQLTGQEAPDINFRYSNGEQGSVHEGRGKVLLVNFWASWCEPCMKEMPSLKALENHFAKDGLVVLAFNVGEEEEKVRGHLVGKDLPRNLIFSFNRTQLRRYAVQNLPISVLIGRGGIVRRIYQGARNWAELRHIQEIELELK
jgi:thiol-disulfide isomerase/thioredoxin